MARGLQKIQAQQKAAAKGPKQGTSQLAARDKALGVKCPVCFAPMSHYKTFVTHFSSKHPDKPMPSEADLSK